MTSLDSSFCHLIIRYNERNPLLFPFSTVNPKFQIFITPLVWPFKGIFKKNNKFCRVAKKSSKKLK